MLDDVCFSEMCNLPMDSGPCNGKLHRWYYNSGACETFEYGGCLGNDNRFFTIEECLNTCHKELRRKTVNEKMELNSTMRNTSTLQIARE